MTVCTNLLHKKQLLDQGRPGMNMAKKVINKYFLNLENSRKKKSCIRKLNTENDKSTTNPKETLNEIQLFYANL